MCLDGMYTSVSIYGRDKAHTAASFRSGPPRSLLRRPALLLIACQSALSRSTSELYNLIQDPG